MSLLLLVSIETTVAVYRYCYYCYLQLPSLSIATTIAIYRYYCHCLSLLPSMSIAIAVAIYHYCCRCCLLLPFLSIAIAIAVGRRGGGCVQGYKYALIQTQRSNNFSGGHPAKRGCGGGCGDGGDVTILLPIEGSSEIYTADATTTMTPPSGSTIILPKNGTILLDPDGGTELITPA